MRESGALRHYVQDLFTSLRSTASLLCTGLDLFMLAIDDRHGATTSARLRRVFRSTSSHHRRSSIAGIMQPSAITWAFIDSVEDLLEMES